MCPRRGAKSRQSRQNWHTAAQPPDRARMPCTHCRKYPLPTGAEGSRWRDNEMDLPLDDRLRLGIQTIHRRTEPAEGPWLPAIDELCRLVELVDRSGYDSLWVGDHVSFALPILDPLLQLAQAA